MAAKIDILRKSVKSEFRLSSLYLSAFPALCSHYNISPKALADELEVPVSALHDDSQELSHQQVSELLCLASEQSKDPLFALELSARIDFQALDVAMLLVVGQESMRNIYPVLDAFYSYQNRATRHQLEVRESLARHSVQFLFDKEVDTSQHALLSIGGIYRTFKEVFSERLKLTRVCFRADYQGEAARLEAYFGCKVIVNAEFDGFEFAASMLNERPQLDMEATARMRRQVSHGLQNHNTVQQIVTNSILLLMPLGDVSKGRTAKMLGVHPRTLQNLLSKNQLSYRSLLNEIRNNESKRLLEETDRSVEIIAHMNCYSSAEAFIRQFKALNGITPLQYRKKIAAHS